MRTVQEQWWAGDFGRSYLSRNRVQWNLRVPFWDDIINWVAPQNVLEIGTNAAWNLRAIKSIRSDIDLKGVDVNPDALAEATAAGFDVEEMSALDVGSRWPNEFDLVFTSGCLIHVSEIDINAAMSSIVAASRQYVLAVEYKSACMEEIPYRGYTDRMWRRPFGKMYQEMGLKLIVTGFLSPDDGYDNCTYWLLKK